MTQHLKNDWRRAVHQQLFDLVPCNIAVIDRNYTIVDHNDNFAEVFGEGKGRPCYEVYKHRSSPCEHCLAKKSFSDGQVHVNDEVGVDKNGRTAYYVVHMAPVITPDGDIPYIIEMSTDVTETRRLQREYQILFERVPCYVAVLNRDLRIVRANEKLRDTFGDTTGEHCFRVLKKRPDKCDNCPAEQTFEDGKIHTSEHVGISQNGRHTNYIVTTSPLSRGEKKVSHVIEMALDITQMRHLEAELARANEFREILIQNSLDAVMGVDSEGKMFLFNPAAEKLSRYHSEQVIGKKPPQGLFPEAFNAVISGSSDRCLLRETELTARDGEKVPVRFAGFSLKQGGKNLGAAAFLQDLREIKRLENEKIEAERLAAVGQTVAGLAHGIKNILTGLEGGMYVFRGGLEKDDRKRIDQGWHMLERNIERISGLVRNLLSFSKGDEPEVGMVNPVELAEEVVNLYGDAAAKAGIIIRLEAPDRVAPAPMDREGIHSCLANLVSNAIDACQMSEKAGCKVTVRCVEERGAVVFEVADEGCGMDYDIKQKVFTTFFTTKGAGGTGLGLLLTRKIVQQHGGKIDFASAPGEGTTFRLIFPRERLPRINTEADGSADGAENERT